MASPIIEIENVSKSYGKNLVLNNLSLTIMAGEKVSMIGPSGSGKTTILRILMTLTNIDQGMIRLEGEPLWHMERNGKLCPANNRHLQKMRRKVGMVFQQFNLFPHLSVLSNVASPPTLVLGVPKAESKKRAIELLRMVGMDQKVDQYPAQLSGGQQQRVAIARALNMRPKIMLFDEVTSALDPELVEEVLSVLRKLATETDITMLFVTHEMRFAHEISDRVFFLDGGRIVEEGRPDEIFIKPRETRTQSFLRNIISRGNAAYAP
jgi:polar amino acid transport system ATP-binding protein